MEHLSVVYVKALGSAGVVALTFYDSCAGEAVYDLGYHDIGKRALDHTEDGLVIWQLSNVQVEGVVGGDGEHRRQKRSEADRFFSTEGVGVVFTVRSPAHVYGVGADKIKPVRRHVGLGGFERSTVVYGVAFNPKQVMTVPFEGIRRMCIS